MVVLQFESSLPASKATVIWGKADILNKDSIFLDLYAVR